MYSHTNPDKIPFWIFASVLISPAVIVSVWTLSLERVYPHYRQGSSDLHVGEDLTQQVYQLAHIKTQWVTRYDNKCTHWYVDCSPVPSCSIAFLTCVNKHNICTQQTINITSAHSRQYYNIWAQHIYSINISSHIIFCLEKISLI